MSTPVPVRVLIADDHAVVREGLAALLTPAAGFCLVGAACNGEEAVRLCRQHRPDVVVLDVHMPVLDGLSAAKVVRREFPNTNVVLLSACTASEDIYHATRLGVKSYLLKDTPTTEVLNVLRRVAAGETYFPPQVAEVLTQRLSHPELSRREKEVLNCLAAGQSNQEISSSLFIAEGTVKAHVNSIFNKMGVDDRTQAVIEGIKRGLVQLN